MFHIYFRVPPTYVFNSYSALRVKSFFEKREGKKIVVLGNSRTRFAIPLQVNEDSLGFTYLRIVRNGSRIITFQQIVEEVLRNNPDYLLIQSDFFLVDSKPSYAEFKRTVIGYFLQKEKLKSEWLEKQFFSSLAIDGSIPEKGANPNELNEKLRFLFLELKTQRVRLELFEQVLKLADNQKTKIVFFDVPIADGLIDTIQNVVVVRENYQFLKTVSDGKKVIHLTFQSNFPDSLYFDFTHFNRQGRKVYFKQFVQKMDSLISGVK